MSFPTEPNTEASVTIDFQKPLDGDSLSDVQELAELIMSNPGVDIRRSDDGGPEGAKLALTATLAVIGAVTGVAGIVLQALAVWKQDKPNYSITITDDGRTYAVDNLSREEFLSLMQQLNSKPASTRTSVKVSKRGLDT